MAAAEHVKERRAAQRLAQMTAFLEQKFATEMDTRLAGIMILIRAQNGIVRRHVLPDKLAPMEIVLLFTTVKIRMGE